jgi:hypothetical protein
LSELLLIFIHEKVKYMRRLRTVVGMTTFVLSTSGFAVNTTDLSTGISKEDIVQLLVSDNVIFSNVTYTGAPVAAGIFTGGAVDGLGIDQGIMLSSGAIANAIGPNNSDSKTTSNGLPGDVDLDALVNGNSLDASVLEFDLECGTVVFNYVFASEEYNEYVNSSFNDVFAFFADGQNIALLPSTTLPVSINNVNKQVNSNFYNDNDLSDFGGNPPYNTQFDGFTTALPTATSTGTPGAITHLKLAIADRGDYAYDSAVFLEGKSLSCNQPPVALCEDKVVSADNQCLGSASVEAGSYDPDGEPWTIEESPEGPFGLGATEVSLIITDPLGETDVCSATVTVVDETPSVVEVADMIEIWPPNHKYRTFTLADCVAKVTDNCVQSIDPNASGSIVSIHSDEPEEVKGNSDGKTFDDIVIVNNSKFKVRSERQGKGNGRVYGVNFVVTDEAGNKTESTCFIGVPHDQSGNPPFNDGPAYTVVP